MRRCMVSTHGTRRLQPRCARTVEAPAIAGSRQLDCTSTPTRSTETHIFALSIGYAPGVKTRPTIVGLVARLASAPRRTLGRTIPQASLLPLPSRSNPEKEDDGVYQNLYSQRGLLTKKMGTWGTPASISLPEGWQLLLRARLQ